MSNAKPIDWTLWGSVAALFLLPAAVVALQYKKFLYAIDSSEATVSAESIEKGKIPSARNLTVTDAVLDSKHTVTWILLEDGSEKSRYYLIPLHGKGGKPRRIAIVLTSDTELSDVGTFRGLVRNLDGDGVSAPVVAKFEENGLKVDEHAVMIEANASSTGELLSLLFYVGIALFAPLAVIGAMVAMRRKAKADAGREVKIARLRENVPADLKTLEDALQAALLPFAPANGNSFYVNSFTAVGPFKVTLHVSDQDRDAPPDVFALVQRIHECYRAHGVKVESVHYYVERGDPSRPWKMRARAS